jgi:hypothetical protein
MEHARATSLRFSIIFASEKPPTVNIELAADPADSKWIRNRRHVIS